MHLSLRPTPSAGTASTAAANVICRTPYPKTATIQYRLFTHFRPWSQGERFAVRGYSQVRTEYPEGEVHFTVAHPDKQLRCAVCGSRRVIRKGGRKRRFRGLPIGRRSVWIVLDVPRLGCKDCGAVRQAEVDFAPGQHRYTKRFGRYVLDLVECMAMSDVAKHLGVSWNLVKTILKAELRRRFSRPRLRDVRRIAIDEICIGRGHRYLTVLGDWIARARATGIGQMRQMADTLSVYKDGVLAYYDVPISTGPLEGTNTKIKLLQRQAYGYRDQEFFRLRIFALHETRYELVG